MAVYACRRREGKSGKSVMESKGVSGIMTPAHSAGSFGAGAIVTESAGERLSSHSRFVQRLRRRYASELSLLPPGAPTRETMRRAYESLRAGGHALGTALRILRQLVM